MIEVKLEDFEKHRGKMFHYASKLLKNRGFAQRDGEINEYANDIIQESYLVFSKYNLKAFVTERHFINAIMGIVYKCFLQTVDINRRGAQYILLKERICKDVFKNEFSQMNVRTVVKPSQDEFDCITSFKEILTPTQVLIVDELLKGYSQKETSENIKMHISTVNDNVAIIRKKYLTYENKNK